MILEIASSLESFKTVRFHCGMNILLADTGEPNRKGHTRNSTGKTSLIELVHFLLGAKQEEGKLYTSPDLHGVRFTGTFQLKGDFWKVSREVGNAGRLILGEGNPERYGVSVRTDSETGERSISLASWKAILGDAYFQLSIHGIEEEDSPYAPSFRGLIGYFCRRYLEGGFQHADRYAESQQKDQAPILLSYLLGLDWDLAREFVLLGVKRKELKQVEKAAKGGFYSQVLGRPSELRPQLVAAQRRVEKLQEEIAHFRVVEAYDRMSRRASELRSDMRALADRANSLQEALDSLEASLHEEGSPARRDVRAMYEAIGIELPGVSMRRFEEVEAFHKSVVANRKKYLSNEIARLKPELAAVRSVMEERGAERSKVLQLLDGAGALEDLNALQRLLAEAEARSATLREQLNAAQYLETEGTNIKLRQVQLEQRLQGDLAERAELVADVQGLISELGREIYSDRDVVLRVDSSEHGPRFVVDIPGDRGGGIHNVEIFLMDLILFISASTRFGEQRFLIHDSHIFDGVDERQIAQCLAIAERTAYQKKGQYIVTMNSDTFDNLSEQIWPNRERYVLDPRLTDDIWGGLFGMRFDMKNV